MGSTGTAQTVLYEFSLPRQQCSKHKTLLTPCGNLLRPRIGLALSGGGARGIAQIGVLKVLEEHNIPVDAIVGTSIGSIIGGLYASGYTADEIWQIARGINWSNIIMDQPERTSLFLSQKQWRGKFLVSVRLKNFSPEIPAAVSPGQKLYDVLSKVILKAPFHAKESFNDLKIPFRAVATDLVTGKKVIFQQGDLAESMLASSAIPLLFSPVEKDSSLLVDGGLLDNIPIDETRRLNVDLVIAVNTTSPLRKPDELSVPWKIADQVTTIMQQKQKLAQLQKADIVIKPEFSDNTNIDFHNLEKVYSAGVQAARSNLNLLLRRIEQAKLKMLTNPDRNFNVDSVIVIVKGSVPDSLKPRIVHGSKIWRAIEIYDLLNHYFQCGWWNSIRARLIENSGKHILQFVFSPNPVVQTVNISHGGILPDSLINATLHLKVGLPFNSTLWQRTREQLFRLYRSKGYSLATINNVNLDTLNGIFSFTIHEGKIANIVVTGNTRTRNMTILREFPLKEGDIFNYYFAQRGLRNVYSLGLFNRVQLNYHWHQNQLQLQIKVEEKSPFLLQVGWNYSRERRFKYLLELTDENILGTGSRLSLINIYGKRDQLYQLLWQTDRIFRTYLTSTVDLHFHQANQFIYTKGNILGEYQERRSGVRFSIGQQVQRLGTISAEITIEAISLRHVSGKGYPTSRTHQAKIRLQSIVDSLDKIPFPSRGKYHHFYYEASSEFLGSEVSFFKLYSSMETYFTLEHIFTSHPKIAWGTSDITTPFQEMFHLGGANSFYGWYEREKLGRRFFLASIEGRLLLHRSLPLNIYWGMRYDVGAIWENSLQEINWSDFVQGYGTCLAFDSFAGLISIHYGENTTGRKEYYLTAGFHF